MKRADLAVQRLGIAKVDQAKIVGAIVTADACGITAQRRAILSSR